MVNGYKNGQIIAGSIWWWCISTRGGLGTHAVLWKLSKKAQGQGVALYAPDNSSI